MNFLLLMVVNILNCRKISIALDPRGTIINILVSACYEAVINKNTTDELAIELKEATDSAVVLILPQNMESSISKSTVNISIRPNHTSLYQLHAPASEKAKTLPKSQFAWKNPTAVISATFVMFPSRLTGQHMLIHKPFSFCVEVTL